MRPSPSAISGALLVGIDPEIAAACERFVDPYPVLRVGHAAAAVERICVVHPKVVVIPSSLREQEAREVREVAAIVGAEVITLHPDRTHALPSMVLAALEKS
jgi:hypothetical protein